MQFSSSCIVTKTREEDKDLNLFGTLPVEVAIDILSRLPSIRSITKCKFVCKAWRDLIECRDFTDYHLSNPDPHLVVFSNFRISEPYKIMESMEDNNMAVAVFGLKDRLQPVLRSSVKGLILVMTGPGHLLVCNPVTNEYLRIPDPPVSDHSNFNFGFGVSREGGQYKVVEIFGCDCRVYTLGTTRQWRSVAFGPKPVYSKLETERAFAGGNLYWLDPGTEAEVCCFDLEAEVFTYFSVPPPPPRSKRSMCVLKECLCLCDVYEYGYGYQVEVLLMRGEVWSKEFVIREGVSKSRYLFPIKMLEDGSSFFGERDSYNIFYYSKETKFKESYHLIFQIQTGVYGLDFLNYVCNPYFLPTGFHLASAAVFTPNFLPLKTLLMDNEDLHSFRTS